MDDEVSEDVMCATHRALCTHGYAEVTMQDIADESDRSKAALHYHYDTKRDLLVAFLDSLNERLADRLDAVDGATPAAEFVALVEELLEPSVETFPEFHTAIMEIKAQAPYEPAFRERIREVDKRVHDRLRDVLERGIDAGQFRADLDPADTATVVVTLLNGVRTRHVAIGGSPADVRETLLAYVVDSVLADDVSVEVVPEDPEVDAA